MSCLNAPTAILRARDPLRRRRHPRRPRDRALRRARRSLQAQAAARPLPPRPRRADARALQGHRHLAQGRFRGGLPRGRARRRSATPRGETWERFAAAPDVQRLQRRRARAAGRGGRARRDGPRRRAAPAALPLDPAGRVRRHRRRRSAARAWHERARVVLEKPFGVDLESARRAQRARPRRLPRGARLPDRPLPRPRGGPEPDRAAVRQRHVRADLEPRPHRPRPDRRARDARGRRPRGLLRGDRRVPRHGRHPPLPRARLRRDGAADDARGALDRRGDRQGVPLGRPDRPATA